MTVAVGAGAGRVERGRLAQRGHADEQRIRHATCPSAAGVPASTITLLLFDGTPAHVTSNP